MRGRLLMLVWMISDMIQMRAFGYAIVVSSCLLINYSSAALAEDDFTLFGRFVHDADVAFKDDNGLSASDVSALRLGLKGAFNEKLGFKIEANGAGGDFDLLTATLTFDQLFNISVGQTKVPIGLDITSSSLHTGFATRSGISSLIGGVDRLLGISFDHNYASGLRLEGGLYHRALSDDGELNQSVAALRVTWSRAQAGSLYHIGVSVRGRDQIGSQNLPFEISAMSNAIDQNIISGSDNDKDFLIGAEGFYQAGAVTFNSEAYYLQANNSEGFGTYGDISWFIGGRRGYNDARRIFQNSKVENSVFDGGAGALELLFRLDYVEIDDRSFDKQFQFTQEFGVNWHLDDNMRLLISAAHIDRSGIDINEDFIAFNTRLQLFF